MFDRNLFLTKKPTQIRHTCIKHAEGCTDIKNDSPDKLD